ncbi:hypothetical protein GCM10010521_43620 [Streptomyces rameus]|uniref:Uncharacterized protein n=1 Tax=Streptomyces rameus TaxID=68261 RepID=A0ABP6NML4_9ACTN
MAAGALTAAILSQDTVAWHDQYGPIPRAEVLTPSFVLWLLADLLDVSAERPGTADKIMQATFESPAKEHRHRGLMPQHRRADLCLDRSCGEGGGSFDAPADEVAGRDLPSTGCPAALISDTSDNSLRQRCGAGGCTSMQTDDFFRGRPDERTDWPASWTRTWSVCPRSDTPISTVLAAKLPGLHPVRGTATPA